MNRLALLGSIQVTRDGENVRGFESRKALALLCYLAVRAEPIVRVELANLFWGDKTEQQGRGNLSRVLNNLSALFPDSLETNRETVQLKSGAFAVDCAQFDAATDDERRKTDLETVVRHLSSVVPFYRGEFMSGMFLDDCPEFELWLVQERERWQQRIVSVLECLGGYHARREEFANALPFAARLLEIEPWREETHRELMKLLAQTNQRSAALQQYETARRVLKEELNVEPSVETNALYEKIRAEEIAPPKTPPHNLPAQLTTFFGRETELTRIAARLNNPDCRLLTLVGAGGMGKTRLALEAAKHVLNSFRDGIYFVPLASIGAGQTQFIVPAMANALNLPLTGQQEPKTQVLNFLRDKQILLLLDNFEHLLDGGELVIEILQHAPKAKIFVTSREPLNVQAEWTTRVEGLNFPTAAPRKLDELLVFSATRLFVERAQRVSDGFELNSETAPHVIRLAQIVEGMPLALELAAARTRTLRVNEIRAQVEQNFDVLATTMRDVDARHKSLRAVLDWSYAALSEEEKTWFRQLSVFAGGCTLVAAQAISQADSAISLPVADLEQLVTRSLLRQDPETSRYSMLEPIRQYARGKLIAAGEQEIIAARHLGFFVQFVEQADLELAGPYQGDRLKQLETERDNWLAALHWSIEAQADLEQGLRLAGALSGFWHARGNFAEGQNFLKRVLELCSSAPDAARAKGFTALGIMAWMRGEYEHAIAWHEQALSLSRQLGDLHMVTEALNNLAGSHFYRGDFDQAALLYEECLTITREQGNSGDMAMALLSLGELARYRRDYARATELNKQAYSLFLETQDLQNIGLTLNNLGLVATRQGDYVQAVQLHRQSLEWYQKSVEIRLVPECLDGLAAALTELSQSGKAVVLMGAADAVRESIGFAIPPIDHSDYERVLKCLRENLQDKFQAAWEKGRALTLEQAIEFALYDNADAKN